MHGILLYQGLEQHVAVEVFLGRIRVSFDIGNYPGSTMFSYKQINDGDFHTVELLMMGKNLTMRIDDGIATTIINEGEREYMDSSQPLYIGGLPDEVKDSALKKWHIRKTTSVIGCLKRMTINNRVVDFSTRTGVQQYKVVPGCPRYEKIDPCESHMCSAQGKCRPLPDVEAGYECVCRRGYSGPMCDIALWSNDGVSSSSSWSSSSSSLSAAEPTCQGIEYREIFTDSETGCRSRTKVKHRRCDGNCGSNHCCVPKKIKTRRVRLFCNDGTNYIHNMPVIRKCGCKGCGGS